MEFLQMIRHFPVAGFIFLVTIATTLYDFTTQRSLTHRFMDYPYRVRHSGEWYRLFTSMLVHQDWLHLALNMFTFYFFAFSLEYKVGHWQFAVIYIGSGVLANLPGLARHKDNPGFAALGASGAISGIIFGLILFMPFVKLQILFFPMSAALYAVLFLLSSHYGDRHRWGNVDHSAHFWGSVAGILLTLAVHPASGVAFMEELRIANETGIWRAFFGF